MMIKAYSVSTILLCLLVLGGFLLTPLVVWALDITVQANVTSGSQPPSGGSGGGGYMPPPVTAITNITFTGKAYPKSEVTILKDAQIAITTLAGSDANFTAGVGGLSAGSYIFSIYSEDGKGRRSALLTFPVSITAGTTTTVSGIFIAPTIALDKSEVKQGDNLAIFGQTTPGANLTIAVSSEQELFFKTNADTSGTYLYNLDTSLLDMGQHFTKSKAALNGEISSFSQAVSFAVGTKTLLKEQDLVKQLDKVDLNSDQRINLIDFSIAAYWYKRDNPPAQVDFNQDGKVTLVDFSIMAYYWTG